LVDSQLLRDQRPGKSTATHRPVIEPGRDVPIFDPRRAADLWLGHSEQIGTANCER